MPPSRCLETSYPVTVSTPMIFSSHACVTESALSFQSPPAGTVPHSPLSRETCSRPSLCLFVGMLIAHPFSAPYCGPFKVVQPGPKSFKVDVRGKTETVSIDRLKPAYIDPDFPPPVAEPRSRGCPQKIRHHSDTSTDAGKQHTRSGRRILVPRQYCSVLEGSGIA